MNQEGRVINIALVGCGTVGSAVARLLTVEKQNIDARIQVDMRLKYVVDVDFSRAEELGIDSALYCRDYQTVLKDESIDAVVELIGGLTTAKDVIEQAIKAGKNVVTANKALIAHHGPDLLSLARNQGVCIGFEASCAGGIPIVRALTEGLVANRITALYGILNGTCNYILTAMGREGKNYEEALQEAQKAGLAEADPTLDVSGHDTAHKIAILASLAFGKSISIEEIPVTGIDTLKAIDVAYGEELGYVMKLLAIAKHDEDGLSLCVRPAFISKKHPLAWVSGPFNAVSVYGSATGHTMYYGRGAGGPPTASAVIADLYGIASGIIPISFRNFLWQDLSRKARPIPLEKTFSSYYIRIGAQDSPGVLAQIASRLGENDISIRSVLQKEPLPHSVPSSGVPVVITTHRAGEGSMQKALNEIDSLKAIKQKSVCMAIVSEHTEFPGK